MRRRKRGKGDAREQRERLQLANIREWANSVNRPEYRHP